MQRSSKHLCGQIFNGFRCTRKPRCLFHNHFAAAINVSEYGQIFDDLIGVQESEEEFLKGRTEGGLKIVTSSRYERSPSLRNDAIKVHGYSCVVCGFNFENVYGDWGKEFIEVHHIATLASNERMEVETDPETDLTVLCANCHRMIHRKKGITLTIEELKSKMKAK